MTMMNYIYEQPELFRQALANRKAITDLFGEIFSREQPDSIYLIASGTSGNAARAAAPFLELVWDRQVNVLAPSQLIRVWGKHPLLLLISQGGKSTNMLNAAKKWDGYLRIAITGYADAKLNALCNHHFLIPCGEENIGPKTKGYTITILLLYLMALETGYAAGCITKQKYDSYIDALETAAEQFSENIKVAEQWTKENAEGLKELSELYLIGKGQSASIAREGALKVMETLLIPASAYDFEEYLHGPSCSLREATGGFYFLPSAADADYRRIGEMAGYHREICPYVYLAGQTEGTDKRDCRLRSSGEWFTRPFEEILPLQFISAVIPEQKGINGLGMKHFKAIDQRLGVKVN